MHVSRAGDLVVTHDPVPMPTPSSALPRLGEVFDLVRGRMGIYVELKGDGTGAGAGRPDSPGRAPTACG